MLEIKTYFKRYHILFQGMANTLDRIEEEDNYMVVCSYASDKTLQHLSIKNKIDKYYTYSSKTTSDIT